MKRARVKATWSKVLWSSLRTMTRQAPPSPLSGPAVRGRSMVCDIRRLVVPPPGRRRRSVARGPVARQPGVLLLDGHRRLDRRHLAGPRDAAAIGLDPRVLVEVARLRAPLVEVGAQAVQVRADVL